MFLDLMRKHLKPKEVNDALTKVVEKSPPDFDANDSGKILGVDKHGNLEWKEISGGLVKKITYQGNGQTPAQITMEEPEFILGIGGDAGYSILPVSLKNSYGILFLADSTPTMSQLPISYSNGKLTVGSGAFGWSAEMCFNSLKSYDLYYVPKQTTNRKKGR